MLIHIKKFIIRVIAFCLIYFPLLLLVYLIMGDSGPMGEDIILIIAFATSFASRPLAKYILSFIEARFKASVHETNQTKQNSNLRGEKRLISKGWLRLHIVLSLLSSSIVGFITEPRQEEDLVIILIITLLFYWAAVGISCWVIKGFRDN